jgi:hypothetical protein
VVFSVPDSNLGNYRPANVKCLEISRMHHSETSSATELLICVLTTGVAVCAFLLSHTFYVTRVTYAWGAVMVVATGFLYWLRFRKRANAIAKSLRRTFNVTLTLVTLTTLLYVAGVATWYE